MEQHLPKKCPRLLDRTKCLSKGRYERPTYATGYGGKYLCTTPGKNFAQRVWVFDCSMCDQEMSQICCSGNPDAVKPIRVKNS